MGDGLLFVIGIICFFILWVVGGGPSKPISFTGPFITPITNVGDTQNAYGSKIPVGGSISAAGGSISVGEKSSASPTKIPNTSPYTGRVFLNHYVAGTGDPNPNHEYLSLQVAVGATQSINISGWSIVSTVTGVRALIPQGVQYLKLGTVVLQPIILPANTTATITTGFSPVNVSYEDNACSNFLSNQEQYAKCFAVHSNDSSFLSGTWRIYLNRSVRLWQNQRETIELLDQNGKVVDSFSY